LSEEDGDMSNTWLRLLRWCWRTSEVTGLPSCEPTVSDLDRLVELLPWRGVVKAFWGDKANGGGAAPRVLAGVDVAVVAAFCKLGGTLGTSNVEVGCSSGPDWCDKLDELLEALRRPSLPCPAEKETSSGEDGCETRLGEELL
jgi:hypothetical protein